MRATLVGHACWLIETPVGPVLTDPVFRDVFEQGTVTPCPAREVDPAALPAPAILYISHRHLDHFDAPTLRRLPRDRPTLAPEDGPTLAALRRLGFTDLRPMQPFEAQRFAGPGGTLEILPIPGVSEEFAEYGAVFTALGTDGSRRTLFNQVDTPLTRSVIEELRERVGRPDVHLAMYASQSFGFFHGRPDRTAEEYARNLDTARRIGARAVVPAAAGFRFVDAYDHFNRMLFPISRERFVADLRRLAPKLAVLTVDPGDVLEVGRAPAVRAQASDFVRMREEDSWRLRYDPTAPVPPLVDPNPGDVPPEKLHAFVGAVLERGLPAYLDAALKLGEEAARSYADRRASYRVEVVFPDGPRGWTYALRPDGWTLHRGEDAPAPDAMWRITASALVDLCEGRRGAFAVRPESRIWSSMLVAEEGEDGVRGGTVDLPDLLSHFILNLQVRARGEEEALLAYYGLLDPG